MAKPAPGSYSSHYEEYINLVHESDLFQAFNTLDKYMVDFFNSISESRTENGYAPGKWSIKDVLQHLIDCERIFGYRALCIARGEQKSLPGFDDEPYAQMAGAIHRKWHSLCEEFDLVRKSTKMMFESFNSQDLVRTGSANNHPVSPLALGYIILGHAAHHINIIKERYLTIM